MGRLRERERESGLPDYSGSRPAGAGRPIVPAIGGDRGRGGAGRGGEERSAAVPPGAFRGPRWVPHRRHYRA
jgi:hypothetical protein